MAGIKMPLSCPLKYENLASCIMQDKFQCKKLLRRIMIIIENVSPLETS